MCLSIAVHKYMMQGPYNFMQSVRSTYVLICIHSFVSHFLPCSNLKWLLEHYSLLLHSPTTTALRSRPSCDRAQGNPVSFHGKCRDSNPSCLGSWSTTLSTTPCWLSCASSCYLLCQFLNPNSSNFKIPLNHPPSLKIANPCTIKNTRGYQ